jgi:hypothetical protein
MLALYRELPFILIGDSGQRDPEIYARIVRDHPGRVLAIYIRNVSRDPARVRAIEDLALEVVACGSSLLLAADSPAMAEHAAAHGLIPPQARVAVLEERAIQDEAAAPQPTVEVARPGPRATRRAVREGRLAQALEQETRDGAPANVLVEAEDLER